MVSEKSLNCRIHTPDGTVYEGEVSSLVLPGEMGKFGVLYNHISYMALLGPGMIELGQNGEKQKLACGGGFAEIEDNDVTILAETAELPEDIDRDSVHETVGEIKNELKSGDFEDEIERNELEADLERAQARLDVVESTN